MATYVAFIVLLIIVTLLFYTVYSMMNDDTVDSYQQPSENRTILQRISDLERQVRALQRKVDNE